MFLCTLVWFGAVSQAQGKQFAWSTELNYAFMPKLKMNFVNGIVRNPGPSALPDADARYSRKVQVDKLVFTLPDELCETTSACYKADLNGDKIPDYVFVDVKVWNGRYAGESEIGIFVSNSQRKYNFQTFRTRHLEAVSEKGRIMLVKYAFSDDGITLIRQYYSFDKEGRIRLNRVGISK